MSAPILAAALVVAVGYAVVRLGTEREPDVRTLRTQLRRLSGGSSPTVERLVRYEQRLAPRISEVEAYKRAIARLQRDRR